MEIFYTQDIDGKVCRMGEEDTVYVIDGAGSMYECRIVTCSPKAVEAQIVCRHENWGGHPYRLHMAVA